jgi:hypothetical protein
MDSFGALSAAMPSTDDKAGQFLDTMKSIYRGEMATADNIPGVKGHIDKKTHEAFFEKDGTRYNLGAPGAKNYTDNVNKAFTSIAEKYFRELGEMQGETFEAKWSTMTSAFSRGMDDMVRKTGWWEKAIKPATVNITDAFRRLTPHLTNLSQSIFDKVSKLSVFDSLEGKLGTGIDNAATWQWSAQAEL